jgi:hypothetical protein
MKETHDTVFTVASVTAILTAGVAAMTVWLFLAQPLDVATAVNTRDLSSLMHAVAAAIGDVLVGLFRYL